MKCGLNCMNKERSVAVFYTCGTCNLKCRYCNIDKNPVLAKIDEKLAESFEGDYYFNQMKEWFPNIDQLRKIETWGGEPFLHMERIYNLITQVIEYYPYFDQFFSSTNFSYPEWTDKVFGLTDQFAKYPERTFRFTLQLSMDGPEYINDPNRGKGVTKRCIENFNKLMDMIPERLPNNVVLEIVFKQTLDTYSVRELCDKQKIIEYFQFFENFYLRINELNLPNVLMSCTVPNTAVPAPVTKKDGEIFAEFCRLCNEIEVENYRNHYFRYYESIMPYFGEPMPLNATYEHCSTLCGSGSIMVCLLPDNLVSTCHEGFTSLYEDYKKFAQSSGRVEDGTINFNQWVNEDGPVYVLDAEGYKEHERFMGYYNHPWSTARMVNTTALIRTLALADEIERKYLNEDEALRAAHFMAGHSSYCIKDNYNVTGSHSLTPVGLFKLLLNGAKAYIEEGERRVRSNG